MRSATCTSPSYNPCTRSAAIFTSSHCTRPNFLALILATWANLHSGAVDLRSLMIGQWPWYLGTLEQLSFGLPEQDYWRVDRPREETMLMRGLSLKNSNGLQTYIAVRDFVRWKQQVKGVPEYKAPPSKSAFLFEQLKSLATCFVFIDMCNMYAIWPRKDTHLRKHGEFH